jgi:shikimate dehydrogenase
VTAPSAGRPASVGRRSYVTALLGQGIGPSLSPELHEREGARQGLRYAYQVVELADDQLGPDHLRGLLAAAVEFGFAGLNVTHPVKQVVAPLVDDLEPDARAIGAINTVVVTDGVTRGYNTDVTGFAAAVREGLPDAPLDQVVLLGAGGAGTAVAHALAGLGVGALWVVDTDASRAERLIGTLPGGPAGVRLTAATPDQLPRLLADSDGLVNATPVGMAAHPGTPLDPALLREDLWVADIVYRPLVTALVRAALDRGCRVLTGAGMAVNQAADSFELFTGVTASRSAMSDDFGELVAGELDPGVDLGPLLAPQSRRRTPLDPAHPLAPPA